MLMKQKVLSMLALLLMAATGAVAQTETLLTTITATAKEQASFSTANVATVSFSYTAGGSSAYLANWGWWGYGWSATVTAAEGYTITKCVFYDDSNRTATDSEAPFVVETTEEDKTPQVNGTPILAYTSKGIKKIEVYGYANPTTVAVTGVSLSQTEATMTVGGETLTLTATVAPDDATDKTVTWTTSDPTVATVANGVVTAVAAGTATITATATNGTDDTSDDFSVTCEVTVSNLALSLDETTDNSTALSTANGKVYDVTLMRTLQSGSYNTFAVPFSMAIPSGWTVKELSSASYSEGVLTLNFDNASSIEAGKPYLVKVDANVANPTFNGVTISSTTTTTETTAVDFIPTLGAMTLVGDVKSILFLGAENKLINPSAENSSMKGFRAYFLLKGDAATARAFNINFEDGETTGIESLTPDFCPKREKSIYTLDGRRVVGQPSAKGVYVVSGKKVIIK